MRERADEWQHPSPKADLTSISSRAAWRPWVTSRPCGTASPNGGRELSAVWDALSWLRRGVVESERVLDLDDLGTDRGVMDVIAAEDYVIGEAPAPIAVGTDNGPCFHGVTFADAFAGVGHCSVTSAYG